MFYLEKEFSFCASHQLIYHDGKCAKLHGHNWVMRIRLAGHNLVTSGPKQGMLMDYSDIRSIVDPYVEKYLDHQHLNETLNTPSPTSEYIAEWLWQKLAYSFMRHNVQLACVTIEETCTCRCIYTGPGAPQQIELLSRPC